MRISHAISTLFASLAVATALPQDNDPFDPQNHFVNPTQGGAFVEDDPSVFRINPVYQIGSKVPLSWVASSTSEIWLWQEYTAIGQTRKNHIKLVENVGNTYDWTVAIPSTWSLSNSNVFFLACYTPIGASYPKFQSHYFNITTAASSSIRASTTAASPSRAAASAATVFPSIGAVSTTSSSGSGFATVIASSDAGGYTRSKAACAVSLIAVAFALFK